LHYKNITINWQKHDETVKKKWQGNGKGKREAAQTTDKRGSVVK
jgi:hypothetical protein